MGIMERECQLRIERTKPEKAKFPVIDSHTHFGKLFGSMVNSDDYFNLYDTEATIEKIKSYDIERVINLDGGYGDEYLNMMDKIRGYEDFIINFGQVDVEDFQNPDFEKNVYKTIKMHHENGIKGLKFWKVIGLGIKDNYGNYLKPNDKRLKCIWQSAAEFHMPVLFHIGDLTAFFHPADPQNEYFDTFQEHPEWLFNDPKYYRFEQLMEMQEDLLQSNSDTTFIIPHVGSFAENLSQVGKWLDKYPNMYVDIADRLNELGRQPYTARKFFTCYSKRILFGTDLLPTDVERYPIYWEFLETFDEYFPYRTENGVMLGNWNIYGIGLEDSVLQNIYSKNIKSLLNI